MYLQLTYIDAIIIMACMYFSYLRNNSISVVNISATRSMSDNIKVFKLYLNTMESICICI